MSTDPRRRSALLAAEPAAALLVAGAVPMPGRSPDLRVVPFVALAGDQRPR